MADSLNSKEQDDSDDSVCSSEKVNNQERRVGTRSLWEITLLGNHIHYWNAGLPGGMVDFLIAGLVIGGCYLCLIMCLAEMTSALPFGGGLYGIVRVTLGPYVGFLTACCEMLQSIIFAASLIYPAGYDLAILFGMSRWYALPFWVLLLAMALLVNVVEVKYFWRINVILVAIVVLLFCVYYVVSMPCMDCDRYGGGLLEGKVSAINWFTFWIVPSYFFDGLVLLPMACGDAVEPRKTVPRAFLWTFGITAISGVLLIITAGCNAPGVAYYAIPETNALYYGYVKGLHIDHRLARVLSIPALFATASAFTYVYGIQLRSMAQSANFSRRKNKRYPPSTLTTPKLSPASSTSHMGQQYAMILNRVAACLPTITKIQRRLHHRGVKYTVATTLPTEDKLGSRNESQQENYSSTVTGESRLLQSVEGQWEESHESTIPIQDRTSLFSLSSELVEYQVRRHPAGHPNNNNNNKNNAKDYHRVAPDYEYMAEKVFPASSPSAAAVENMLAAEERSGLSVE
eukprot:scaffold233_cov174-Ochromonas_danica.AAC.27